MDDGPPPTDHVLRPHHITLLVILSAAFKDLAIQKLPKRYALHIHRVLLNEVAEVCTFRRFPLEMFITCTQVAQPKAHKEILAEVCSGPSSELTECENFKQEIITSVRCNPFYRAENIL